MSAKAVQATWSSIYEGPSLEIEECIELGDWSRASSPVHTHREAQILILAGRSCLKASSSTEFGQRRHKRVNSGEICVTPSGQPHAMDWDEAGGSMTLGVSPDFVIGALEGVRESSVNLQERYGSPDVFVQHLANLLRRSKHEGHPISRLRAESVVVTMLVHLSLGNRIPESRAPIAKGRLAQVVEYIESNLNEQLSLSALASIAQLSAFHFGRQFRTSTGLTPHQYVIHRRIDRAKEMLRNPQLTIAEIAFDCGFATQAHLTAAFRKRVGSTPKGYRDQVST